MHNSLNIPLLVFIFLRGKAEAFENLKSNENVGISEFMEGFSNCEIQIVYDKIDRIDIGPYESPITIVNLNRRLSQPRGIYRGPLRRDISRIRDSKCKISFIVCNISKQTEINLTDTGLLWNNKTLLAMGSWFLSLSDYRYKHKDYSEFSYDLRDVSKILISTIGKSELEKYYIYPRRNHFTVTSTIYDKLGVVYSYGNKSHILCAQPAGIASNRYSTMQCEAVDQNIVHTFNKLNSVPTSWMLKNVDNMDILHRLKAFDVIGVSLSFNPVNRTGKFSIYQHLLQVVFSKANESLHFLPRPSIVDDYKLVGAFVNLGRIELTQNGHERNIVPFKFNGYQFLTCHSESFVSFQFYIIPFQHDVWGLLVCTISILVVTLLLYQKYHEVSLEDNFCPWLFVLANIFEEAGHIPQKLERKNFFRLVLGGWILMSVILTNCYNGLMISYLNSPFPKAKIPEKFQDLLCDDEDTTIIQDYEKRKNISIWFNTAKKQIVQTSMRATFPLKPTPCFKIYSAVSNNNGFIFLELLDQTWKSLLLDKYDSSQVSLEIVTILLLGDPKHILTPRGHYISTLFTPTQAELSKIIFLTQEEISKCEKSVLVIEASDSVAETEYLTKKFPHVNFCKSKDTLRLTPFGWSFEGEGKSRVPKYFQSLVETGIQGRLDYERRMRKIAIYNSKLGNPVRKDVPLGLGSALITLFMLSGCPVVVAVFANIAEVVAAGSENAARYPTRYPQSNYPYPHGYPCGYPLPVTRYENQVKY
ncbi:hypothetical protein Fcan01_19320 [Folsomia candida]|uniref:Uncharacterized protein n=1 Tax=Folsomia candida TaxID=158441 RepID=A0A226DM08_FOLCA|nr:hypothetical protein Fcan01_19320 [Folsomia candida]